MAVAGEVGDSMVSLGNGCLCCAVDASELDVYLERLADPPPGSTSSSSRPVGSPSRRNWSG